MSDAEDAVLRELEARMPGDWVIMHSLWLRNHPLKAHAEVDFVLITDRAVLLLEIKGGIVWRDAGGLWCFQPRSGGHADTRREGPIEQVRGAYYAIKQHLSDVGRIDLFHDLVWGYGVITPDCAVTIPPTDTTLEPSLWLDVRGFPEGLRPFLEDVTEYWRQRCLTIKRNHGIPESTLQKKIPPRMREELRLTLQPVIQHVRGIGIQARQAEAEIRRLTIEQYRAINVSAANERIVLLGAAGTGKTVLALEQALTQAESRPPQKVLLTCYSRLLADDLAQRLRHLPRRGDVEVGTYHQTIMALLHRAGMKVSVSEDWERFNENLDLLVLEAVEALSSRGEFQPYDYLVMDEGQDLLHPAFFQALEVLLKGGLAGGRWLIALDPAQAIFSQQFERDLYDRILTLGARATLSVNCRNTRQIAAYVAGLTDAGAIPVEGADGPEVKILYYDDVSAFLRLLKTSVNSLVGDLDQGRMPPGEVIILTPERAFLPPEVREPGFFIRPLVDAAVPLQQGCVQVATVHSFKGMEAPAVILVGFGDIDSSLARRLLYVGGSRARTVLRLLVPRASSEQVQAKMARILEALAARSGTPRSRTM